MRERRPGVVRVVIIAAACSLALGVVDASAIHLDGDVRFRGTGRCLDANGGVPAALLPLRRERFVPFRIDNQRVDGTMSLVFDYDPQTGSCRLQLIYPLTHRIEFDGLCPAALSLPLASIAEPRRGLELQPFVVSDAYGFGSMNGHLVFPAGGIAGGLSPLGLSAHFVYTSDYVPPSTADGAPWVLAPKKGGPGAVYCIYVGTLQLGDVPAF